MHSETGQTPIDRWEAGREHVRNITPEELADTFLWEEDRQVTRTGDVQLAGNRYPVPAEFVGQRVVVRYDPFDLAEVQVVLKGRLIGTFRPAQLVTRTFSKAQPRQDSPRHLDSATAFKQRLVSEGTAREQAWSTLAAGATTAQTDAEFELQLADLLGGRLFSEAERQEIVHFKRRYGPRPERTDRAVIDAVAIKGIERPLAYYLDAIEAALSSQEA